MSILNKRKINVAIVIIFSTLLIVGCTNRNLVKKTDAEDEEKVDLGSEYGFTSFNLSVDTTEMKEALISEYDEKIDKTEAVYESKIDNLYLHGDKAMEKLDKIFKEISLNPEMDDEDMIKETSKAFEVIDYKVMKLKVQFKGHDTKELMMSK